MAEMIKRGEAVSRSDFFALRSGRFFAGIAFAAISFALCWSLLGKVKAGAFFAALFVLAGAVWIRDGAIRGKWLDLLYAAWLLLAAFATGFISQTILSLSFLTTGAVRVLLTMCIALILFLAGYVITLRPVLSVSLVMAVLAVFSFVNRCVFAFRGSEIQPCDLLSIRTAGNVAAEYQITVQNTALYGFILTVLFIFASLALPHRETASRSKARILSACAALVLGAVFVPAGRTVQPLHYLQGGSYVNGFLLNFTLQFRETFVSTPAGYSAETVQSLGAQYRNDGRIADAVTDKPDIIVIMDESFADLSILGSEPRTNIEVTPFIDALSENTVRGYALSSVYGGGTPNSEYEFLTGNSMLFLPPGAIVYQQYLKQPCYSMVEELKENGYQCIAMHPFVSSGWVRTTVYSYLGFDETHFIEDFPAEDLVRDFVSDREMFEKTVDLYEEKKAAGQDVFLFGVTMQNHGGYVYEGENYQQTVTLEGYEQDYDDAEQYLTLIHETDAAVEYLLDYFSGIEDNVVVVFYGDHLPNLDNRFYEELHGGAFETLDEQQLKYTIPFFIWTNYDIEEETVERTSLNYLSNYVYRAAGFALPEYNEALADVQSLIPAMNANGYYSPAKQAFTPYQEADGKEAELLNFYNQLEYNSLFDEKNRDEILFPIGERAD